MKKSAVSGSTLATLLLILVTLPLCAASAWSQVAATRRSPTAAMATSTFRSRPWEFGPVIQGGVGTGNRSSFSFFSAGVHVGKVLTSGSARHPAWTVRICRRVLSSLAVLHSGPASAAAIL